MTRLLEKAVAALENLPAPEQDAIARELLDRIEADERWERLLDDPRSSGTLARLAGEARTDIAAGDIQDGDPSVRQGK